MELSHSHCGRKSRIRYDDTDTIRRRAAAKSQERRRREKGAFVLGRWMQNAGGVVFLEVLPQGPAHSLDTHAPLTTDARNAYRWTTKQAAHQLRAFHPELADLQVINLAAALTRGQHRSTRGVAQPSTRRRVDPR